MKSPAGSALRPTRWDVVLAAAILLAAAVTGYLLYGNTGKSESLTAVVTRNGEEIARIPLDELEEPMELSVEGEYTNIIRAERGRVCIIDSTCPGRDCVHQGWISRPGQHLICLPNHVTVTIEGSSSSGVDAVSG
ncbi:NusG domain II-containing protein [Papillibacter cinnamivorans]|uniref:Uncharacterized protein n=1 Tax=Papillibacter cinnamivorans DSM 12816 TaxID=1122930 RepID=A0A1W2BG27_9FIRM|nr:NusG domain II-containing protein [Papillibacter cinnamivorans]SMC71811.1 hypothetical protein SAMN02745168_2176 [Papillibacter cinnamivorans DSM 12816]